MKNRFLKQILVYLLCFGLLASSLGVQAETLPNVGPQIGGNTTEQTETDTLQAGTDNPAVPVIITNPAETQETESESETETEAPTEPETEPENDALSVEEFLAVSNSAADPMGTLNLGTEKSAEEESAASYEESYLRNRRLRHMVENSSMDTVIFRGSGYLNVRAEADATSALVGKMYYDDTATVTGKAYTENGVWFRIESGSVVGYVKSEYVLSGYDAAAIISESNTRFAYILRDAQRVYRDPNSESDQIGVVYGDSKYQIDWISDYFTAIVYAAEGNSNVLFGYIPNSSYELVWELQTAVSIEEENASREDMNRIRDELASKDASREESRRIEESIRQSIEASKASRDASIAASIEASKREREQREAAERASRQRAAEEAASREAAQREMQRYNYGNYTSMIPAGTSQRRINIVTDALKYVGWLPYVTNGHSLSTGADCSGFLMEIYRPYGIHLAHYSYTIARTGTKVIGGLANARPADIICYRTWNGGGHVAMFIGYNSAGEPMMVHAPDVGQTVKVSYAYPDGLHTVQNVLGD